ncbi:MAG: glycosyltransferase [Geobacteraceae bacterium GWC2_58_44]|nr:MAG: glycosyltransferase [Geobacteraceae bacterium GWC2_58_44]HBG07892.1 glycosyltransferase family 2 protein [Geobacter sp.]
MVPFITVVMPVRNEARFIADTLGQLLAQEYPPDRYEILVADGMSDDGTQAIVQGIAGNNPQVRLLVNPKRFSSSGRNIGFRNGRGEYFLVVDGHCFIPDGQLFNTLVHCFLKSGAACLGRPQPLDPPGLSTFQVSVALARASRLGHGGDSLVYADFEGFASPVSNGAAYTAGVFDSVGYVDENFDAAEDVEFNYRIEQAGLLSYSSYKLTVRYYPRESICSLFRQMKRYGIGRRRFIGKHPNALTVNQLAPSVFTVGLVFLPLVCYSLLTGRNLMLAALAGFPYLLYATFVTIESIRVMVKEGWRYGIRLPAIFLTIHTGLGVGFITGEGRR